MLFIDLCFSRIRSETSPVRRAQRKYLGTMRNHRIANTLAAVARGGEEHAGEDSSDPLLMKLVKSISFRQRSSGPRRQISRPDCLTPVIRPLRTSSHFK